MTKQKPENDPALIEATARQIAIGMGDEPDDLIGGFTAPKNRTGRINVTQAQHHCAPAWTAYTEAAERVLRYLLVERIVLVKRDTIDPKVKAKVLADPHKVMTEDDITDPAIDALQIIIDESCANRVADVPRVSDAMDMLHRVGYVALKSPTDFWCADDCWKPTREGVWAVVRLAHSVNGIGSDFMWKARAKLFPDAPASTAQDHST